MKIYVEPEANEYVREIVQQAPGEIGGIGYIESLGDGEFYVHEFVLLPQDAGNWHVDFDGKDYIQEITRAAEDNRENQLRLSWHSHANMGAYFSQTDDNGVKEYAALGMPWLVSLVFNKQGDVAARCDVFDSEPFSQITVSDDDAYIVDEPVDESLVMRVKNDIKKFVRKPPKQEWNKQTGKKDKNRSEDEKGQPIYVGWSEQDDLAWSDDDYEDIAKQIMGGGYQHGLSVPMTEDEEDEIKELMEKNEPFTF